MENPRILLGACSPTGEKHSGWEWEAVCQWTWDESRGSMECQRRSEAPNLSARVAVPIPPCYPFRWQGRKDNRRASRLLASERSVHLHRSSHVPSRQDHGPGARNTRSVPGLGFLCEMMSSFGLRFFTKRRLFGNFRILAVSRRAGTRPSVMRGAVCFPFFCIHQSLWAERHFPSHSLPSFPAPCDHPPFPGP